MEKWIFFSPTRVAKHQFGLFFRFLDFKFNAGIQPVFQAADAFPMDLLFRRCYYFHIEAAVITKTEFDGSTLQWISRRTLGPPGL